MADQGKWFKLWCSADEDPDLANLSLEDFGRWCKLGMYVKLHGSDGTITLQRPAFALQQKFHVSTYDEVREIVTRFPHCKTVSCETSLTVSFCNWLKYQGDFSTQRVRKFREMKRLRNGREEKRREPEEKRREQEESSLRSDSSSAAPEKTSGATAEESKKLFPFGEQPALLNPEESDPATPQHHRMKGTTNRRGMGKPEWPASELWLQNFLQTQTFVNLPPAHLNALQNPDFWERTSEACGGIDLALLQVQFAKMGNWLIDHPSRVPTAKGIRRFVSGWLERAYEMERRYGIQNEKPFARR